MQHILSSRIGAADLKPFAVLTNESYHQRVLYEGLFFIALNLNIRPEAVEITTTRRKCFLLKSRYNCDNLKHLIKKRKFSTQIVLGLDALCSLFICKGEDSVENRFGKKVRKNRDLSYL